MISVFLDESKVIKCLEYVLPPLNVAKNQHKKGFAVFVFNGISLFLTFCALVCCPYYRLRYGSLEEFKSNCDLIT